MIRIDGDSPLNQRIYSTQLRLALALRSPSLHLRRALVRRHLRPRGLTTLARDLFALRQR